MSLVAVKKLVSYVAGGSKGSTPETSPLYNANTNDVNAQSPLSQDLESGAGDATASNTIVNYTSSGSDDGSKLDLQDSSDTTNNSSWVMRYLNNVDPRVMSDLIIGLSDGLTVPFALTAGLSSLGDSKLVITGGMAELVSGAISMGLGGYLAAKSESEFYFSQVRKEKQLFFQNQDTISDELFDIIVEMGASEATADHFVHDLSNNPQAMIDFIIRYGKGLEEPPEGRIVTSALTIGAGYFFGGFVPLIPYFFLPLVQQGLLVSVLLMIFTLFWFGYVKSIISMGEDCSTWTRVSEGFQMVLIGSIAAGSAWTLVFLIDN